LAIARFGGEKIVAGKEKGSILQVQKTTVKRRSKRWPTFKKKRTKAGLEKEPDTRCDRVLEQSGGKGTGAPHQRRLTTPGEMGAYRQTKERATTQRKEGKRDLLEREGKPLKGALSHRVPRRREPTKGGGGVNVYLFGGEKIYVSYPSGEDGF